MGFFEHLCGGIVSSHVETHIVDPKRLQVNVLIVAQAAEFGWHTALNDENAVFSEMRCNVLEATNLLVLRAQVEQCIEDNVYQAIGVGDGDIGEVSQRD